MIYLALTDSEAKALLSHLDRHTGCKIAKGTASAKQKLATELKTQEAGLGLLRKNTK